MHGDGERMARRVELRRAQVRLTDVAERARPYSLPFVAIRERHPYWRIAVELEQLARIDTLKIGIQRTSCVSLQASGEGLLALAVVEVHHTRVTITWPVLIPPTCPPTGTATRGQPATAHRAISETPSPPTRDPPPPP